MTRDSTRTHDRRTEQDRKRALDDYGRRVARLGLPQARPPAGVTDVPALRTFTDQARAALDNARKADQEQLAELREQQRASSSSDGRDDERCLNEAFKKVESSLLSSSAIKPRLAEGKRSMMAKVDRLVVESLEPEVDDEEGKLTARVAPQGMESLRSELPQWVEAWSRYTCGWLDKDLHREVDLAWSPPRGDLSIPPPPIAALEPRVVKTNVYLPEVHIDREQVKLGAGIYRHARSVLYGILSLTFLLGLRSYGSSEDSGSSGTQTLILVVGIVVAVFIGFTQVQAERAKERNRLQEDLLKKGRSEIQKAVHHCLDRAGDRLLSDIEGQLFERRQALVRWYREQVVPAIERNKRQAQERKLAQEQARKRIRDLETRQRELREAGAALDKLVRTLA